MPTIKIPLRPTHKDVLLPLVHQAYKNGRYGNDRDDSTMPEPPLEPEQFNWITQHLNSQTAEPAE